VSSIASQSTYAKHFARDLAIVAAVVALWIYGAGLSAGDGIVADLSGLLLGVALGACALPLHEWGHFVGARASRSAMRPAENLRKVFAFSFDSRSNSQRQFLAMTFGGWLGTAPAVWIAYGLLPSELLATRVARGMTLLSVLLVVVTEVPLLVRALWTGRIPPVETVAAHRPEERASA
jgi:hypothetical protein